MDLRERVERVLTLGGPTVMRLGAAGTSIAFSIAGNQAAPVTLLLDREPPVLSTDGNAEIAVELDADSARAFERGELVLATCLMEGRARCSGPIRKYLAVDPILRRLLHRVEAEARAR